MGSRLQRVISALLLSMLMTTTQTGWWSSKVEESLDRAPTRKATWVAYLNQVPKTLRPSVEYLMADLPFGDLLSLQPERLSKNVRLALKLKSEVPWVGSIPGDVFNDAVLPDVNVGEPRDSMRSEFHARYLHIAKSAKSPGEAALALNRTLFKDYRVAYNTKRLRTDQSPRETIAQGIATCTGLSIMLVDACRAIGIPARIAGIHSWPGRGGNHTWVEVWDGDWHFVGAAEPDPKGLDHGWFAADAAKAVKDVPVNAIYAVTYRSTGDHFPCAWDDDSTFNAVNVTDRYRQSASVATVRLMIDVSLHGERVQANVEVVDAQTNLPVGSGMSMGPAADTNNFYHVDVSSGHRLTVKVNYLGKTAEQTVRVHADTVLRIQL